MGRIKKLYYGGRTSTFAKDLLRRYRLTLHSKDEDLLNTLAYAPCSTPYHHADSLAVMQWIAAGRLVRQRLSLRSTLGEKDPKPREDKIKKMSREIQALQCPEQQHTSNAR